MRRLDVERLLKTDKFITVIVSLQEKKDKVAAFDLTADGRTAIAKCKEIEFHDAHAGHGGHWQTSPMLKIVAKNDANKNDAIHIEAQFKKE